MAGDLKKLADLIGAFTRSPRAAFRLLGQLPRTVDGFDYARELKAPTIAPARSLAEPNRLRAYFENREAGRGIWKWNHYFEIYQRHLAKFVGRKVTVLEIGVYSGGSLEMWREYFGERCTVLGVDLQEACRAYENEYTRIHIGDQADRTFWRRFRNAEPRVDVLIDDGGHRAAQQIATLEEMLSHLQPGGVYLCEDVHGEHHGFGAYMSGLVRELNAMREKGEPTALQRLVKSVHFYPYVTVIERAEGAVPAFAAPKRGTEWAPFSTR